jgi:hypothetical protein
MLSKQRAIPYEGAFGGTLRSIIVDNVNSKVLSDLTSRNDNKAVLKLLQGIQITESEDHPSWRKRVNGSFKGDVGGPFSTKKQWVESVIDLPITFSGVAVDLQRKETSTSSYVGPMLPINPIYVRFPTLDTVSESKLNQLGTTAIARCSPSNPTADASVFLKETLSEGIPHLFLNQLKALRGMPGHSKRKALGDAYLNVEFGWKPFVSDFDKLTKAILNANEAMLQYERDSGKIVRRSYHFPEVKTEQEDVVLTDVSPWYSPSGGYMSDPFRIGKGKVIRKTETFEKTWFSGAFTYYVPPDYRFTTRDGIANAVIRARKTVGLSLTPDVVWNSSPWSWAVDWFSNSSEVLQNWSDFAIDNQVLLYGYIMQHRVAKYTYRFVGDTGFRTSKVQPPDLTTVVETKVRRRATPYGFGLDFSSFSTRQKAIVAALGLSRKK